MNATEASLTDQIASARRDVMAQRWAETDAKESLAYKRASVRQRIVDMLPGFDENGKPLGLKALGPNEAAQTAAIEALLQQDTDVADAEDTSRRATRDRERAELTLTVLLDERTDEHWSVRREAVARGVSLGDGAQT